jgi:nucleotide-binding universal stress UspA family protein
MSGAIRKILVATDLSPCSQVAADRAVALAAQLGATVTLLHAYPSPLYPLGDGGLVLPAPEVVGQIAENARKDLEPERARVSGEGVAVDALAVEGPPAATIVETAKTGGYDLIVVGTHGRTGLAHLVIGSVAERVVRAAECPVLTVH